MAVGAAFLRKLSFLHRGELWLCLHFWFNLSAIFFTVFGFIFAILAAKKDGTVPHFQKETHHKVGLTIFIMIFVQAFVALLLPQISNETTKQTCGEEEDDTISIVDSPFKPVNDDSFSVKNGLVLFDDQ